MPHNDASATLGGLVVHEMRLMYGSKFAQQWQGLTPRELREAWDKYLMDLTEPEVLAGLRICLTRDWPPTLPEFLKLCRPWLDAQVAFQEAVAGMTARRKGELGHWSHPAVYWAAVRVGAHDLLACGWQTMRNRWETAFNEVLAQGSWHPVPAPAAQLPAPGQSSLSRDEASRMMAQVRQMTGQTATPGSHVTDHKAWARKILDNPKGKTRIVIRSAQQALGLPAEGMLA